MKTQSDRAREVLLDAAEELFARNGIDAVSNRRIVEHAGAANHSAIAYHFGGRDGLLRALVARHQSEMIERRRELMAGLSTEPNIHELVTCRLRPLIELLDSLPRPSWRAQFMSQMAAVPSAVEIAKEVIGDAGVPDELRFINCGVNGIPAGVLRGRAYLLGSMVVGVCADQEAKMNDDANKGSWEQVGRFLIDAASGMLGAPVTDPDGAVRYPNVPLI
ncbi:TetR/AcrR family transcriptional regulator [Brevibacterium spongiae]|uniref:TetR/AcrR family transcriptional regulator n=1 Tax=Brevibacterium spongiae TaxID=2909672 RepID=A0ABY5SS49_9MICO|nr:helix-turn-helix domain-containing protein [Brevibacterium spongiae]UVI37377.1 TetR/AcrR family transcriptional regulator [Brevibacterium spongiae]